MRRAAILILALATGFTLPAAAEILTVPQDSQSAGITIVYGVAPDCGDRAKIIHAGETVEQVDCVRVTRPEPNITTNINIVVLARKHHRPYIRHD